ncbi:NUDIX hydrolase [Caldisalinibacter kiritimatiensis]|uniref:Putative nudix hydrolase YeaB n=1 Tax=Caldisalinibacter kiritimatiensis TaxID=1304284 RepID=R1ARC0_9FIRM|nr:CoA pyrophosphatase [Caldisalinibacter kiritimatiensis]EOC99246.1 Putative nudix hydrolase YeaB [Caldisalinibacter kiritimatiensis]
MDLQYIEAKIKNREPKELGINAKYAVLLPLIKVDNQLHILYQVRAYDLDVQPGEVCFPGGRVEQGEGLQEAAIRETYEELGIDIDKIKIIGELDYVVTPYNFSLHPFLGVLEDIDIKDMNLNKDEVHKVFTVPIEYFKNNTPKLHKIKIKVDVEEDFPFYLIPEGRQYKWRTGKYPVYFYQYQDYIIWGMTARITKNFIDTVYNI